MNCKVFYSGSVANYKDCIVFTTTTHCFDCTTPHCKDGSITGNTHAGTFRYLEQLSRGSVRITWPLQPSSPNRQQEQGSPFLLCITLKICTVIVYTFILAITLGIHILFIFVPSVRIFHATSSSIELKFTLLLRRG